MARGGFRVVDVHHHVGELSALGIAPVVSVPDEHDDGELSVRLAAMDEHGVDQAVVMPGHGYLRPDGIADTRRVNEWIAAYRDRRPDRFPVAIGIVEPLHGDRGLDELEHLVELQLRGVSLHARFQGVSTNSPLVVDLVRRATELGLVPFVHAVAGVADEALWRVHELARAVPDATVVVLDALSGAEQGQEALRFADANPNTLIDLSTCQWFPFVEQLVERVGAERLMFGTGTYSMSPLGDDTLRRLLASELPSRDKEAILCRTAERLLGLSAR